MWGGGLFRQAGRDGGISCSSLKNGVFLTVPAGHSSASAAELLTAAAFGRLQFVRQAAKGGR